MKAVSTSVEIKKTLTSAYLLALLLGIHMALPAYLYSTFLSQFLPERFVGALFTVASIVTILVFTILPRLLKRIGNLKTSLLFLLIAGASTAALGFSNDAPTTVVLFIASYLSSSMLIFNFDVFLEHSTKNATTGQTRGTYLVFGSAAWIIAQLLTSLIIGKDAYMRVLFVSAAMALPMLLIIMYSFKTFPDPHYSNLKPFSFFSTAKQHRDIVNAYLIAFLLHFFYVWMIVYTPIYLHNYIGFELKTIALMFSIMLIPFVIIPRLLGTIADKRLGEKELLVVGFLIMAFTTGAMTFITSTGILIWTAILFLSRIGASTVEAMSETYFFKKVNERDISLIGAFRTTRPWAYVIAPLVATIAIPFSGIQYLFLILGLLMGYGALRTLSLNDTR